MATATERKKLNAEQYLAENGLRSQLENITAELVRFSPQDPLDFICTRIQEIRSTDKQKASTGYSRPRLISVLGGPASGKAVQCAHLVKELGMVTIAPSELLRNEIKEGTPVGKVVGEMLHENVVVPTDIITKLIKQKVDHHIAQSKDTAFVLDGYPRTLEQAIALEKEVAEVSVAVFLECEEPVMKARMTERSQNSGIKEDDHDEKIAYFSLRTYPVIEYFRALGKCKTVDANRQMDLCMADVLKIVRD